MIKIKLEGMFWNAYRDDEKLLFGTPDRDTTRRRARQEYAKPGEIVKVRDINKDIGDEDAFKLDPDLGGGF